MRMKTYAAVDAADTLDAKPLVACHMYPVVTMGEGRIRASRDKLLGERRPQGGGGMVAGKSMWRRIPRRPSSGLPADDVIVPPLP